MPRGYRGFAGIHQHEAAGAVSILDHPFPVADLPEERRLLIAGNPGQRHRRIKNSRSGFAIHFAGGTHLREQLCRHPQHFQQLAVPFAAMDIEHQGAGGVGDVGDVMLPPAEAPEQPAVDGAEGQPAGFGLLPRPRDMIQDPAQFGAGEVGIEHQAGLLLKQFRPALTAQLVAHPGSAAVLPDDRVINRIPALPVPYHRRLPLVGDADGGDIPRAQPGLLQRLPGHLELRIPNFQRIMLHPPRLRKYLAEFLLRHTDDPPAMIE